MFEIECIIIELTQNRCYDAIAIKTICTSRCLCWYTFKIYVIFVLFNV